MNKLFCVVFRTGGTDNFKWQRSASMTRAEADTALAEMQRGGHHCHIAEFQMSMAVGLPETF